MIALSNREKLPRSLKGLWSMEVGWAPGGSEVRLRCAWDPLSGGLFGTRKRFRVAGNTYVLAEELLEVRIPNQPKGLITSRKALSASVCVEKKKPDTRT